MEFVVLIGLMSFVTSMSADHVLPYATSPTTVNETCILTVTNESRITFTETIFRRHYNFMYMHLNFEDMNTTVKSKLYVIAAHHWIWTYKGEDGGHNYLFLPQDFGYLSFGLLWSKSNSSEYTITIHHQGNCSGLTIGEAKSDLLIGEALGNMTGDLANRRDIYNSSYWCYNKRMLIHPLSLYRACENSICTLQSIEYRCCKYVISFTTRKRHIECSKEHYHFSSLWWALPIISGEICFAFYPLFLSKIGSKIQRLTQDGTSRQQRRRLSSQDYNNDDEVDYIRVKQGAPVTLLSTVLSPVFNVCRCRANVSLRLWRMLIIIMPMALPAARMYLDWKYSRNFVKEALDKGAVIGFSSLIAGPYYAGRFMYFIGGPEIALTMYFVFGTIFIMLPKDLETLLVNGLFNPRGYPPLFILTFPIRCREKLGRISVRNYSGYKRFHNYLLLNIYMILNLKTWRQSLQIFVNRLTVNLTLAVQRFVCNYYVAAIVLVALFPFYVSFCVIEVVFSLLYLAFPVISCFYIILNAYMKSLLTYFGDVNLFLLILSKIVLACTVVAFSVTWYVYCVIFFDGFWFLSRIITFTFTGLVQFPKLSYGYIVLAFMAFYYLMDSLHTFGTSYRDLLKLSTEACERVQNECFDDFARDMLRRNAIPRHLFNVIVERHQPKRVKVCYTVLKVVSVVSILWISIGLLKTFDKFQDLSLVSHVFTVLFICALPKILNNLCLRRLKHTNKKRLRQRIYRTVRDYCLRHGQVNSDSDLEDMGSSSMPGYDTLDIESD